MDAQERALKATIPWLEPDDDPGARSWFPDLREAVAEQIRQSEQAATTKAIAEMKAVDVEIVQAARVKALEEAAQKTLWFRKTYAPSGETEGLLRNLANALRALKDKP